MTACQYGCPDARLYPCGYRCDEHRPGVEVTPDPTRTLEHLREHHGHRGGVSFSAGGTGSMIRAARADGVSRGLPSPSRGAALPGVRRHAPDTSHALSARLSPLRERSVRLDVFATVAAWTGPQGGLTDDDLERMLGRAHQSVSATRNALVADGYLEDSLLRRPTRYGNPAVVWRPTPLAEGAAVTYARRAVVHPESDGRLPWQ